MTARFMRAAVAATALAVLLPACTGDGSANASTAAAQRTVPVTITKAGGGTHVFQVEVARTSAEQERGLMYRTDIGKDGGMIFAPYPPSGPPREASFWMKNTPTALDIIFIRADGTIATIAENTVPFSEQGIPSGEPVAAVLEILGGRSAELGLAAGDRVTWPK